ncbi:MAG: DUF4838 domain-containing protein [Clostridia bacterium]|nr:DUF4838 domain-containing protein [Clostridia bacterium]
MINKKRFGIVAAITLAVVVAVSCFGIVTAFGSNERDIVRFGKSDYEIVIPENANDGEKNGAKELQLFFKEATGIKLPIVTDAGKSVGGKYFSLGNTSFVPDSVKDSVSGLSSCGYVIKTVGNTVFLLGPSGNGTLYSVYGYLARDFGFEYYFTDVYSLKKGVGDLALTDFDVTVEPDLDMMTYPSAGIVMQNSANQMRFNALSYEGVFISANGTTKTHNLWWIMPNPTKDEEFGETHDKWYAEGSELPTACFTAHGDPEAYEEMQNYFLEVIKSGIAKSSAYVFQIAQPDNCGFCRCPHCIAASDSYGGNSGIMIKFCNDLCAKVYDWFKTQEGAPYERDFKLVFLAYQSIKDAPSGNIKCDDNVGVYIAFDGFYSSYGHECSANNEFYNNVNDWSKKTHVFISWIYDVNFFHYLYPYDSSSYKQDYYRLMKQVGVIAFNDEGQVENETNMTAWCNLKNYITSKLRWDVNANVELLTREFFKNCYKDAWEIMYNVYSECRAHWSVLKYKVEKSQGAFGDEKSLGSIFGGLDRSEYWGLTMLQSWISQFKNAIKAIEPLKSSDKAAYDKAYMMICGEIISPMAILIELYRWEFSEQEFKDIVAEFKSYVADSRVGFSAGGMESTMSSYYKELSLKYEGLGI